MKKTLAILFLSLFICIKPAKAQFPVIDFAAIGQAISTNINLIDQAAKSVAEWQTIKTMLSAIGEIKEGLERLSRWETEIGGYIKLFEMGLEFISDAINVIDTAISQAEQAKELLQEPKNLANQAHQLALQASELYTQAGYYANDYENTIRQAEALMQSTNTTDIQKAEQLMDSARDLNQTSKNYLNQAEAVNREAANLLDRAAGLFDEVLILSKKSIRNQERACLLNVRGIQYKTELQRKFCKNPVPGVVENVEQYCDEEAQEGNEEAKKAEEACSEKAKSALDILYGEDI